MVKHCRSTMVTVLFALLLLQTSCLMFQARNAPPEVKYYAVVADYNVAKGIAAAYAESPNSSISAIEKIMEVVTEGDAIVQGIDHSRVNGNLGDKHFDLAASQLTRIATKLTRMAEPNGGGS